MAKKRGNGEGTVRQRKDGRWEVSLMVGFQDDGKPKRRSVYGKTQKEALENARVLKEKLEQGQVVDKRIKLSEWADRWYQEYKGTVRDSTYEGYQYTLSHIKQRMGHKRLLDIRAMDVESAVKGLVEDGFSRSYVAKFKGMLHQILRKAEANGYIDKNPVPLTEKTKLKDRPSQKDSFSLAEVGLLYAHLPDDRIGHAIRLSIACGMRTQELLALTPEDIDEDGRTLHIRRAVYLLKGAVHVGDTKSSAGVRDIPVPEEGMKSARFLRRQAREFVLQGKEGKPLNPSTYRALYKKAVGSVEGVRVLTPHCCRHTYITLLEASGVQIETIQAMAGHADRDTTVGYMHIKDDTTVKAAEKLSQTLSEARIPITLQTA